MIPGLEIDAAELHHPELPTRAPVLRRARVQCDDPMGDALELQVGAFHGAVVQQQHGAPAPGEELLHREDLASVTQRTASEEPHLGNGIEHHAHRPRPLHMLEKRLHRGAELELGRMEHGGLPVRLHVLGRELVDVDAGEVPSMGVRHGLQLFLRFGERDVQATLPEADALKQELQRERRLAGSGITFDEVQVIAWQTTAEDDIETFTRGADPFGRRH